MIVIDRSPVDLNLDELLKIITKETTGGAGKVAIGDANATLQAGGRVTFIAVAKSDYEKELAREGKPYLYDYNGSQIEIQLVEIPKPTYDLARDGFFSGHLWFYLQGQTHPEIMQPYTKEMWTAYMETNRIITDAVEKVATPTSKVWVHDFHVALVGPMLKKRKGFSKVATAFIGHTAWPSRQFVESEAKNPVSAPTKVVKDLIKALGEYQLVNWSSTTWTENFKATAKMLGVRKLPAMSSIPVPLDSAFIRAQAFEEQVVKRAAEVDAELGDRKLVITGGRAEWYKNIDKVIDAEMQRLSWMTPEQQRENLTVLLTSTTRDAVPGYAEHYNKDIVAKAEAANKKLGFKAFRVVDGNNLAEKFAYFARADAMVTIATNEGYNLMKEEQLVVQQAIGKGKHIAAHVDSRSMGITKHANDLAVPGSVHTAMIEVNPTIVKVGKEPPELRAKEERLLELEIANTAIAAAEALRLPLSIKKEMAAEFARIPETSTPQTHMENLQAALSAAGAKSQTMGPRVASLV